MHDEGAALPARWNLPPDHAVVLAWHETQSASATLAVWSNWIPLASVTTEAGRVFAWQSMHEAGCAASDAWYCAGVVPDRPTAHEAAARDGGR